MQSDENSTIAAAVFRAEYLDRPSLIDIRMAEALFSDAVAGRSDAASAFVAATRASERRPYPVSRGVAVIPVVGPLSSKQGYFTTGYDRISAKLTEAMADNEITAIAMLLDTPGGSARGINALAGKIASANAVKPVVSVIDGLAASAGYWIASQGSEVIATDAMDEVGSIGVVAAHFDISGLLSNIGIKPTLIYAGAHKVDGNPFAPLPDGVRKRMQADVDALRVEFARAVSAGRKNISPEEVMATEARVFFARDGVSNGLVDRIASFDSVIETYGQRQTLVAGYSLEAASPEANGGTMSVQNNAPAAEAATVAAPSVSAADIEMQATARIEAILSCDEAAGRDALARHLAFKTKMSADDAKALLAVSPKESAAPAMSGNAYAQQRVAAADFGMNPSADSAPESHVAAWDRVVGRVNNSRFPA
jgi:signal peptide peptidase SppA